MLGSGLRWNYNRKRRLRRISYRAQSEKNNIAVDSEGRPEYILQLAPSSSSSSSSFSSSKGKQQYMSIPMECLPSIEQAVETVTTSPSSKAGIPKHLVAAARAKNASLAQEEWERNSLLRTDLAVQIIYWDGKKDTKKRERMNDRMDALE